MFACCVAVDMASRGGAIHLFGIIMTKIVFAIDGKITLERQEQDVGNTPIFEEVDDIG